VELENTSNLEWRFREKSKLAQYTYKKDDCIAWKEAREVQEEVSNICRNYK
jgi:hypothetical protein